MANSVINGNLKKMDSIFDSKKNGCYQINLFNVLKVLKLGWKIVKIVKNLFFTYSISCIKELLISMFASSLSFHTFCDLLNSNLVNYFRYRNLA